MPLGVILAAAVLILAGLWWAWLTAADPGALDGMPSVFRYTALHLPVVAGIAAASAGLHIAILAAHSGGTIAIGPRAALYGGVGIYLMASALLPSGKLNHARRLVRLGTALAAVSLVFMGAFVVPVYLVPALTAVLAIGLVAEGRAAHSAGHLFGLTLSWAYDRALFRVHR